MTDESLAILTLCTALGCGLNAGVFFAFSTFVMQALARLPAAQGIAAMQSINVLAITPVFMTALFGTGAACAWLAVTAVIRAPPGAAYLLAGSISYFAGTVVVTIVGNVPRNNELARANPDSAEGARVWAVFLRTWTRWNHVRTLSGLVAAALLTWWLRLYA